MQYSNVVINLLGKRWETRNFTFDDVHPDATRTIAEVRQTPPHRLLQRLIISPSPPPPQAAKEAGVERFIQVSAAGADVNSPSPFARSKVL